MSSSSSFPCRLRAALLLTAGSLCLGSVAQAQTQPTEPPPTPAPTVAPATTIPTISVGVLSLLPDLQSGGEITMAVALPAGGAFMLESSVDLSTWVDESSRVPAVRVGVLKLEQNPGETRRFYRLKELVTF